MKRILWRKKAPANRIGRPGFSVRLYLLAPLAIQVGLCISTANADVYDQQMEQAHALVNQGQYADGEKMARAALELANKTYVDAPHWRIADAQQLVGEALAFAGKPEEAMKELEGALAVAEKTTGVDSELVGLIVNDLAVVSFEVEDYAKTEMYMKRAAGLMEKNKITTGPEYGRVMHNLAGLSDRQKNYAAAEEYYKKAIAAYREAGILDHNLALSLQFLGQMYVVTNRASEAGALAKEALELCEKDLGPDHQQCVRARNFWESLQR
jgi:tetratricopeptide (TPR) repeat protein